MSFQIKIKNIGKLGDANIRIGDLTVFAGPNNTGKSFVSKLLYSLFNAINIDPVKDYIDNLMKPVRILLRKLIQRIQIADDSISLLFGEMNEEFKKLENLIKEYSADVHEDLDKIILIELSLENLTNMEKIMRWKIEQNLIQNFQVPKLSDLQDVESTSSEVEIEDFGTFKIINEEPLFSINLAQTYANLIYLESPFYWKLKNALENIRDYPSFRRLDDRERLIGVPEYFYDLARALKFQYTGDMAFSNVYERLISKDVIGGKIGFSETGDLLFREKGRQFPMSLTATGVANLGILALLIERKVVDKGTFLFIDEPEAHLHPAWQVIMAEALFNIAKQGAKVVIATHSPDILQTLKALVKKNPKDQSLIALNQFPADDNIIEEDFETKMENIMHELTKPFSNQYIESL